MTIIEMLPMPAEPAVPTGSPGRDARGAEANGSAFASAVDDAMSRPSTTGSPTTPVEGRAADAGPHQDHAPTADAAAPAVEGRPEEAGEPADEDAEATSVATAEVVLGAATIIAALLETPTSVDATSPAADTAPAELVAAAGSASGATAADGVDHAGVATLLADAPATPADRIESAVVGEGTALPTAVVSDPDAEITVDAGEPAARAVEAAAGEVASTPEAGGVTPKGAVVEGPTTTAPASEAPVPAATDAAPEDETGTPQDLPDAAATTDLAAAGTGTSRPAAPTGTTAVASPTSGPTSAPSPTGEVAASTTPTVEVPDQPDPNVARLGQVVRSIRGGFGHGLTVSLTPEHLGRVTVDVTTDLTGGVHLQLRADRAEGAAALGAATHGLRTELESQGLRLEGVSVSVDGDGGASARHRGTPDDGEGWNPQERGPGAPATRPAATTRPAPAAARPTVVAADRLDLDL